jgi:outer membrane protein insertion porin family
LGGDTQVVGNIELFTPMPGIKDGSVRLSGFLDTGAVFGPNDYLGRLAKFTFSDFRYSAGVGVAWNSPLGPLKFSLARPLNKKQDDKTQMFQFNLGTTF